MSTKSLTASAGLLITRDSIDVQHIRLDPGVPARIRRFARFIKEALLADVEQPGLAAARLVALDGVRPSGVGHVEAGLPQLYVWREMTHVEWREDAPPRLERRALSTSTMLAVERRRVSTNPHAALSAELSLWLAKSAVYSGVRAKDRAGECEKDALCWWYQCLPMPLLFHVSGLQPLSAVSRLCLAREQMRQVPKLLATQTVGDTMADTESCAEVLDIGAMSSGTDERPTVLRQALERLRSAAGEPDAAALRRWVDEMMQLRFAAQDAGPITSLLLAWGIDMCESGTIRSESPTKETPQKYFGKAAEPLLAKLRALPEAISDWTIELLDGVYRELIARNSRPILEEEVPRPWPPP